MPMRVGEMMVVIRAQDFASRTLRRVGTDLSHLSRQQQLQMRRSDLVFQQMRAQSKFDDASKNMRRLKFIERRNRLEQDYVHTQRLRLAAERNLQNVQSKIGRLPSGAVKFGTTAQLGELRAASSLVRQFSNEEDILNRKLIRFNDIISRMPPGLRRVTTNTMALGDALRIGNRRLEEAYQGLSQAQRAQLAFNHAVRSAPIQRLHDIATAMGGIGRTMQLFGAAGTIAFGLAAREAAEFSKATSLAATQMTRIEAGTGEAVANAARLRKEILDLAKDYPFAAEEMSQATYEIFSSTNIQRIDQGMALLEAFARVGVAGQVDLETATKASITVLNTFKGATDDVAATLNRMFSIVRFGRMRFQDFADMLPKVAAAAYGSGQTLDDVAGIMAFLTRKTGDAGIAATQISRAFDVFARKEFRVGMEKLGVSIEDTTGKLLPLPQVLGRIWDAWGKELASGGKGAERFIQIVTRASQQAGKGLLSTAEARRFFRFIFSDFETYIDLQDKATKDSRAFQRQFETMMTDPGVQWDIFIARVKAGVIAIGQDAIPMFAKLGEHVARFLTWWENLDRATRNMVVKWGVLISAGALVGGVLMSIGGALISVLLTMGSLFLKTTRWIFTLLGLSQLLGGKGAAGLIGRLILMTKILGFLAAIGTITIGIELKKKGGAWELVGRLLATGGTAALLKKAGMTGLKRTSGLAAVLTELIWPDSTTRDAASDFMARIDELDTTLAGEMKKAKITKVQRQAFLLFQNVLQTKGGTFSEARMKVLNYLRSVGVELGGTAKKTKTATDRWQDFVKGFQKTMGKAGSKALFKALGLDEQTLAQYDEALDEMTDKAAERQKQLAQITKQTTQQVLDSLRGMYSQLLSENQQAFGQLFQGPWLTSETFDIAKEWGITPRLEDMIRDLHEQNAAFATWRSSLDKLFKKGLPKGLVDELSAMGPEQGQALVDNLLKGKPGQVKQLIAEWNRKNKQIKDATKMDFTSEILAFKKAGGDMGDAIINGFKSAQVGLWFDGWVKTTFPGVINSAVNQAIADWKKTNPPPEKAQVVIPPDPRNTPSLKTGITAKQRRIEQQSQIAIAKLTAKQTIEQIARTQRRIGATRAGGVSKAEQAILARQNRRLNRLRRHQDELRGPERKGHGRDLPRSAQPKRPLGNTNNTNNSKTINVKMETKSATGDSAADKRRQAFILAGKLKSLLA